MQLTRHLHHSIAMWLDADVPAGWRREWSSRGVQITFDTALWVELSVEPQQFVPAGTAYGQRSQRVEVVSRDGTETVEARIVVTVDLEDHVGVARCRSFLADRLLEQGDAIERIFASLHATEPRGLLAWSDATGIEVLVTPTAHVFRPRDRAELAAIMELPLAEPLAIRARNSLTTPGLVLDMRGLDRIVSDDAAAQSITVEAGCTWAQVIAHLSSQGRQLLASDHDLERSIGATLAAGARYREHSTVQVTSGAVIVEALLRTVASPRT